MEGPFEEDYRTLEQLPEAIQALAVKQNHPLSSFGIYLPIKKWSAFTVYEKGTFDSQIRKVIQKNSERIHIDPDNFLIRIPKFFCWHSLDTKVEDLKDISASRRAASMSSLGNNNLDAVKLLKWMIDEEN